MPTDNFNRSNENPLAGNWTVATDSDSGVKLESNAVYGWVASNGCYWNADAFNADQYSKVKLVDVSLLWTGPAVRWASGAFTCYLMQITSTSTFQIRKCVGKSYTTLGSDYSATINNGSLLKLTVDGDTLTPNVDGSDLDTRSGGSAISSGSAGLWWYGDAGWVPLDDWEGGDVGGGATPLEYSTIGDSVSITDAVSGQHNFHAIMGDNLEN